jgi:hypothetical protein
MDPVLFNDSDWQGRADPFVRLYYQFGMLLGVDEFQQDQGYHLAKHRLATRLFQGWGVVWGDQPIIDKDATSTKPIAAVGPMLAIDELGRELYVRNRCTLDLDAWFTQNKVGDNVPTFLVLSYSKCPVSPVPALAAPCDDSVSPTRPSRILETATCALQTLEPEAPLDLATVHDAAALATRFETLLTLMRDDAPRPVLLGTVTRTGPGVYVFAPSPAPRMQEAVSASLRVVGFWLDTTAAPATMKVRFSLPPTVAPVQAFRVDEIVPPASPGALPTVKALVDTTTSTVTPDAKDASLVSISLTAAPAAGNAYRLVVDGAGATPVMASTAHGWVLLNGGSDTTVSGTTPKP